MAVERTLLGPVKISGGTALQWGRIVATLLPALPSGGGLYVPVPVIYRIVAGKIYAEEGTIDAEAGTPAAMITSPGNYIFEIYVSERSLPVHRFEASVAQPSDPDETDILFDDIYATSGSVVEVDPSLVREGDSIRRLTGGGQYRALVFMLDPESGEIVIPTDEDGNTYYTLEDLE